MVVLPFPACPFPSAAPPGWGQGCPGYPAWVTATVKTLTPQHKTSHEEAASAGLGAGQWHEAALNTGFHCTGVFALGQGHPHWKRVSS